MKHGDKAKAKAAKASKPSDKKVSSKTAVGKAKAEGESREPAVRGKAGGQKSSSKGSGESRAAAAEKAGSSARGRGDDNGSGVFANPLIAAAFKRAVKKYANTFRRLTD